jgi:hypothetical protein
MYRTRRNYEPLAEGEYDADAYQVNRNKGIAWAVLGWETEPDEDTEWSGIENRTGNLVCYMIGDDQHFSVEPDDLIPISDEEFCHGCGQVGCGH